MTSSLDLFYRPLGFSDRLQSPCLDLEWLGDDSDNALSEALSRNVFNLSGRPLSIGLRGVVDKGL